MKNRILLATGILAATLSMAQDNSKRGAEDFPELKYTKIKGAPQLQDPFLVMGTTGPVITEKHGLIAPALWDWDNDGKRDLLVGEFETTSPDGWGENGSTVRVYLNVGEDNDPKFTDEWFYARDTKGRPLEVDQWCCIGFTPQFVDLNDDGILDIITGQYHPGDVTWFRGLRTRPGVREDAQERGNFAAGVKLDQEGNPWAGINSMSPQYKTAKPIETFDYWVYSSANFGDMDGDGDLDLINGGSDITVSENIGDKKNPRFGRRVPIMQTDGKPLTVREFTPEQIEQVKAYGGEPSLSGAGKTQQYVVDWDNDGVLDLLSTDEYVDDSYTAVTFFKGVKVPGGMQKFEPGVALFEAKDGSKPFPGSGQRVYVDDWNKDGIQDLIVGASIVTVDNKFHGKMSWEYEYDLGIPAGGKDIGRAPGQLNVPTFEEYLAQPFMSKWMADKSDDEKKKMYDQQIGYTKDKIKKYEEKGLNIEDVKKMRHQGYVYVFLGKK